MKRQAWPDKILAIVKARPGITSTEIRKSIDSESEHDRCIVAHALTRLTRRGLVKRVRVSGINCLTYAYEAIEDQPQERNCMKKPAPTNKQIVEIVRRNTSREAKLTASDIGLLIQRDGFNSASIHARLLVMFRDGAVYRERVRRGGSGYSADDLIFKYWIGEASKPVAAGLDGEGLSLVGTVCEHRTGPGMSWSQATILAFGEKKVFYRDRDGHEWTRPYDEIEFRPIRTLEQIAADEMKTAVLEMVLDFPHNIDSPTNIAVALYKAGYRKQVAP